MRQVPVAVVEVVQKEVPVVEYQYIEKVVEVPQIVYEERIIEVPQVQVKEVIKQVPKVAVQVIEKRVPKKVVQYVERIVEVPQVVLAPPFRPLGPSASKARCTSSRTTVGIASTLSSSSVTRLSTTAWLAMNFSKIAFVAPAARIC